MDLEEKTGKADPGHCRMEAACVDSRKEGKG